MAESKRYASLVGTLPGPKTGMTLSTQQIAGRLQRQCDLRIFDIGKVYRKPGVDWRLRKLFRSLYASLAILFWKNRGQECIYLIGNSSGGVLYNILHVAAARLRKFRIAYHHNVYNYIVAKDWKVALLLKLTGKDCTHIVACQKMAEELQATYDRKLNFLITPPFQVKARYSETGLAQTGRLVLGHLSNLSSSKGLHEVIETFESIASDLAGTREVHLHLAGPCNNPKDKSFLEASLKRNPQRIHYHGPVYDEAKSAFFQEIDLFLFPTQMDSWGIVLNESLSFGVPAIANDVGCIRCLIGQAGIAISPQDNFVQVAA